MVVVVVATSTDSFFVSLFLSFLFLLLFCLAFRLWTCGLPSTYSLVFDRFNFFLFQSFNSFGHRHQTIEGHIPHCPKLEKHSFFQNLYYWSSKCYCLQLCKTCTRVQMNGCLSPPGYPQDKQITYFSVKQKTKSNMWQLSVLQCSQKILPSNI